MGKAGRAGPVIEGPPNEPEEPAAGNVADVFDPFYERLARHLPDILIPRVSLPLAMALAYLTMHRVVVGGGEKALYPALLALIIFVLPLFLYLATAMFDDLAGQMDNRAGTGRAPAYRATRARLLSDRRFLLAAALFGLACVAAAMALGLNFNTPVKEFVVAAGYFLAGSLWGLALWGIIGIVRTIRFYVREDRPRYDVTAPDGCGGMLFLGRAVTTFGILSLIGGTLISSYLLLAEGQAHGGEGHAPEGWETILLWSWVALPYAFSALVLLAPTFEIHAGLHAYRVREERRIEDTLARLETELEEAGGDAGQLRDLRLRRDDARERRRMLYAMSSWPFSANTHLKYALLAAVNSLVTFSSAGNSSLAEFFDFLK